MHTNKHPTAHVHSWRNPAFACITLATMLTLTGCAGGMSDLQTYAEQVKQRKGQAIEPIPEIRPYEGFQYPEHAKNPFDPSLVAAAPEKPAAGTGPADFDPDRPREYLESFPLASLRMMGTLEQNGQVWALIRTPDGTIQRTQLGNYLGQNYGKIKEISEDGVLLREVVPDGLGGYMERQASLALSE